MSPAAQSKHTAISLSHSYTHTYVIVVVGLIVFLMDDHFFHCELLFLDVICVIDGALPQVHGQMPDHGLSTQETPNTYMVNTHTQKCVNTLPHESHSYYSMRIAVMEMIVCSMLSHPSKKQCAALRTQQGAIREPPQKKP